MRDPAATITPESRLGDVLERWPALEDVLVEMSPHFRALRNPVLRRTVARVATLRHVAQVSGVGLGPLLSRLRSAAGVSGCGPASAEAGPGTAGVDAGPPPAWAATRDAARSHDARAAIEAGEHPLPRVLEDLSALEDGAVYELITPFVPAPLIEMARARGFLAHSVEEADGVRTRFRRERPAHRES